MADLFNNTGATFSPCGRYRYALHRKWDGSKPSVLFIGLNPSTANADTDDPTIRRCIGFAKANGFGAMYMGNLFAWISTDPKQLDTTNGPLTVNHRAVGFYADYHLGQMAMNCATVVFCWGSLIPFTERHQAIVNMFPTARCFGTNADGNPKHPLYLPATKKMQDYKAPEPK